MENLTEAQILSNFRESFESQKYDDAMSILKTNQLSFDPGVYEYNMALVYLKKEDFVNARINFEKAQINGFMSNELSIGLSKVREVLEVDRLEEPKGAQDTFNNIVIQIPFDIYIFASLSVGLLFLLLFKRIDKVLRIILLIISFMPLTFYYIYVNKFNTVVTYEDSIVYRGPSKMFEQIQIIPKGMKLITGEDHGGWKFIIVPESHKGWFFAENVEKL